MSIKRLSKHATIVLICLVVFILLAGVAAFLFIPRKSNQRLLPNTVKAIEAYTNMKIDDKNFTFPKEGLKAYLDLNTSVFGGNNAYEKKYMAMYKRSGIYITLSYVECLELMFSMSDKPEDTMADWENLKDSTEFNIHLEGISPGFSAN